MASPVTFEKESTRGMLFPIRLYSDKVVASDWVKFGEFGEGLLERRSLPTPPQALILA
jgi:hypothetical protein